ncbi:MAG TPA: DUF2196 domain-containing protein, partial [Thermoanaerobaculia bacterium]|nr:DUF2196 domain-containing protein [Thermoanaerobaculia bacterium]
LAAFVLVLLPTAWTMGLGLATGHPYGHDGGVVQLPLAVEKVLAGESPHGIKVRLASGEVGRVQAILRSEGSGGEAP